MFIVTAEQMRAVDEHTIHKLGIPAASLMENAGRAIAEEVIRLCREGWKEGVGTSPEQQGGRNKKREAGAHLARGSARIWWRHHRRSGARDGATRRSTVVHADRQG